MSRIKALFHLSKKSIQPAKTSVQTWLHFPTLSLLLCVYAASLSCHASAQNWNLAPNVELVYSLKSSQKGIPVSGEAKISWKWSESSETGKQYQLSSETKVALFGKILQSRSQGQIKTSGLSPERFSEKRFRRNETITYFDRQTKTLRFSESDLHYPLQGGEQDRLSVTWQLVGFARAAGEQVQIGKEWNMLVAGTRDADPWSFKVLDFDKLDTAIGELKVMHIRKAPPADAQGQQLDLWLATELDYYPVRIRFQDGNGDLLEQKIISVQR
ncbi:DUF3108 domain-containing protein [Undibacterium fentianense]|uniref:DUF3108 domain-containing protein n=1 Tax=Undibacterium fentianense TaxID=2828728 RepID=A0A941E3B7_9BURK|nr:DUF3108 domain-containing protein [Undibacterium fentianense]MBR7800721.1 DUF3108 domain-containing protein [Undibacterium fentianense]